MLASAPTAKRLRVPLEVDVDALGLLFQDSSTSVWFGPGRAG